MRTCLAVLTVVLDNCLGSVDSDILHFEVLGRNIIVLNSFEACIELLEKRSKLYSSRYVLSRFPSPHRCWTLPLN